MSIFEKYRAITILIIIDISLIVLYLISNHLLPAIPRVISHWFDLDGESNIPTWFSSSQLLIISFLSLLYSTMTKDEFLKKFYLLLSLALVFFSADETSMIHEGLTTMSKKTSVNSPFPGGHGMWIFIYSAILLIGAFIFRRSVAAFFQEKAGRAIFLVGSILFVTGGVVLEIVGYYISLDGTSKIIQNLIEVCSEEGSELLGESLLIFSLLSKIDSAQNLIPDRIKRND